MKFTEDCRNLVVFSTILSTISISSTQLLHINYLKCKEAVVVSSMDILKCLRKYSDVDKVFDIIHMFYGMEVGTHRK